MVQNCRQQAKDYQNWTDVDNQLIWMVKQFKRMVALQTMLETASKLSPDSQKPQLPSLAAKSFPIVFVKYSSQIAIVQSPLYYIYKLLQITYLTAPLKLPPATAHP